jgi:hypothetical protein
MSDFGLIQIFLYTRGKRFKYSNNIYLLKNISKWTSLIKKYICFFLSLIIEIGIFRNLHRYRAVIIISLVPEVNMNVNTDFQ